MRFVTSCITHVFLILKSFKILLSKIKMYIEIICLGAVANMNGSGSESGSGSSLIVLLRVRLRLRLREF
jgi:hypothetical protein